MDERFLYKKSQTLREYVSSFHLFIMFLGLAITSIGAYLINSNTSKTVSIALLAIGGLITITSFIGYFGAQLENTGFLNTYSSITAIALILELTGMSLAYTHKTQLYDYGSKLWTFFYDQDARFLSEIEQSIQCCGYDSTNDRAVPKTCSISLGVDTGCKDSITLHFQQWHEWITVVVIILLFVELMSLIISVITSVMMDREAREEETYMTLLSSRNNTITNSGGSHHYHPWSGNSNNGSEASYNFGRHYRSSQKSIPRYGSTPSTK